MSRKYAFLLGTMLMSTVLLGCGAPVNPGATATATPNDTAMRKVTPSLLTQVEMRQQEMKQPSPQRREQMQAMGMDVTNIPLQRIFIHMVSLPADAQVQDMRTMGVVLYLDSWIPPAGGSPTGFLLAAMPVNVLRDLASRDYVVKLETAEKLSQPLGGSKSKGPK
ncbi:MAG: hypothetical protein HYY29_02535 [Chloroflexi bacterium]|nr:hypothetical protein [Chloroflexota bacterium]